MIQVRKKGGKVADFTMAEFESLSRRGLIRPQDEVLFPAITGDNFVEARTLELYQSLYASSALTFRHHFNLARMPWMTLALILILIGIFFFHQGGALQTTAEMLRKGGKNFELMVDFGEWWRLLSANFLHVSGWHLLVNAVFLFNLGGPAEAIYRRHDYLLIIFASLLGTTLLSILMNPQTSCGASGVVFGLWGSAAVFGLRHRTMLPDRYRRYFLGSVIPYAIFALYIGLTAPNTDNWGHLGGLIAGASVATFLPPRLLEPKDSAFIPKIVLALLVLILIFGMSFFPPSLPEPQANRYYAFNGFSLPIPRKWSTVFSQRRGQNENRVYANSAGVNLSVHTEYTSKEVDLVQHLRAFVESDLAIQLEQSSAQGLQMSDPIPTHVAGLRGLQFDIRVLAGEEIAQASYIILARSHYVYIVGYVAPDWLYQRYITVFTKAIQSASLEETDWLSRARDHYNKEHSIKNTKDLVRALYAVGQKNEAQSIIKKGKEEHDIDPQIFISNPESSQ